jgi:ring-1,2-phenylacetyl-CoA epoxidase subunit PaaE
VRGETDEAVVVSFDVPTELAEAFRFTQGQHLNLRKTLAGREERRSYSICAGVGDGELRVGVRKVAGGRFSTWNCEQLRPGDRVEAMPPEGRFFVPVDPLAARSYLAIAAGSGITPILSIAKTVLDAEPRSRFTLIYGNRKLRSTMFLEELEDLKNRHLARLDLHLVFSQEATDLVPDRMILDEIRRARPGTLVTNQTGSMGDSTAGMVRTGHTGIRSDRGPAGPKEPAA